MRKPVVLMVLFVTMFTTGSLFAAAEDESVEEVIAGRIREYYFEGIQNVDVGLIRKIFDENCPLLYIRDGELVRITQDQFRESFVNREPEKWDWEVISVDVTGNAAMAKVRLENLGVRYIDYLSLLKIKDEWWIVNKIFVAEKK